MNGPFTSDEHAGAAEQSPGVVFFEGAFETLIRNPGAEYSTISWSGILEMAKYPSATAKTSAPAIIPSTYCKHDARSHDVQREHGEFVLLAVDIDKGNHVIDKVVATTEAIVGDCGFLIYSTGSSSADHCKWRVLIPLLASLPGDEYAGVQAALFSLYADDGIECDPAMGRPAQPVFLPNVPPDRRGSDSLPLFYAGFHRRGEPLDLTPTCTVILRCTDLYRREREERERAYAEARQRQKKRENNSNTAEQNPTQWFNEYKSVEALLLEYGYKRDRKGNWQSPHQKSGSYATRITEDGLSFVSLSGSDSAAGLGAPSQSGAAIFGDAYDLYCHYEHKGDHQKAWAAIRRMMPRQSNDDGKHSDNAQKSHDGTGSNEWTGSNAKGDGTNNDPPLRLVSFREFVASRQAPDYLLDGVIQCGWLYSITAMTGSGKTAVALLIAMLVSLGKSLCSLETLKGRVVYLAGENPEDIKSRCLMLSRRFGVEDPDISFLEGAVKLDEHFDWFVEEIDRLGGASLVIIDTAASYFGGEDDNNNVEFGEYARLFRRICKSKGRPTVVVLAHPTKNPRKDNLLPRGGGAFLNEVDGNLTLWTDDGEVTSLHWQGKFRGPNFEPMQFKLEKVTDPEHMDRKGRQLPSVIAVPLDFTQAEKLEEENLKQEDRVLLSLSDYPDLSVRDRARLLGFLNEAGAPLKSRVERALSKLAGARLVVNSRRKYRLTPAGEAEVNELRPGSGAKKGAKDAGQ